ncbi:Dihydrodipicolinate reductase (DHPR) [Candidatus Methylomirabilis oxygeniifera]|uniref:4-hydroxy-tetrahydrodipicolinate reductase n=1 Tax=Methylomirabilis oxygeniifera TaxID=671143 RepID=D5MIK8_METO1|nr:Dihydrodipicolinate reductase (DHPR) [Candidatus Methylomirabilis oxyfera]
MGGRIIAMIREASDFILAGAVEQPNSASIGRDAGEVTGIGTLGIPIVGDLGAVVSEAQVVIDFTAPQAAMIHLAIAAQAKVPVVVGTTGFSVADLDKTREIGSSVPCVLSPNMSIGVNVLFKVLAQVASALGEAYDVEIVETHHRFKKDAPSGTALKMAQVVAEALGRDLDATGIYGRKGLVGERGKEEIAIHALRAGDVVGDHTVIFGGMGERIEMTHRAHSRDNFAHGALRAAHWVIGRPPGLYDMQDVLGLKEALKVDRLKAEGR